MPPETVIRLERIFGRHGKEAQTMRVADEQAAAHHGKKNVGPHPSVDDFGHARGVVAQGAEAFPQVLYILVGHTSVELDVGVGGRLPRLRSMKAKRGSETSLSGEVTKSQNPFGPRLLATRG